MMSIALTGLEQSAFLYLLDIIVFGCSPQHHNDNLRKVFAKLRHYNLKLNTENHPFPKLEVIYLGNLIK